MGCPPLHGATFAVVQHDRAVRLADELDPVLACATLGDLLRIAGTLTEAGCPEDLTTRADQLDETAVGWE